MSDAHTLDLAPNPMDAGHPAEGPVGTGSVPNAQSTQQRTERSPDLQRLHERIQQAGSVLTVFEEDIRTLGFVGDTTLVRLLYLIFSSRYFRKPISIVVKGASAGGKSYAVESVLMNFFPQRAYLVFSSMSEKSMVYTKEPFEHRIVYLAEAAGAMSESLQYQIRTLLSEGRLVHEVTVTRPDGDFETVKRTKRGPICLVTTTTQLALHAENETRLMSYTIDTHLTHLTDIFISIAEEDRQEVGTEAWMEFHEELASLSPNVSVPFGKVLASMVKTVAHRQSRDFHNLLYLIMVSAFLHHPMRERDDKGRIVAVVEDYGTVYVLIRQLFSDQAEATIPQAIRDVVDSVHRLTISSGVLGVKATSVAEDLGLSVAQAGRRIQDAIERGFLIDENDGKRNPKRLKIGEPMPQDVEILPTPDQLRNELRRRGMTCE